MALWVVRSPREWRPAFGPERRAVATVGNFDGVHIGHRRILARVVELARERGALPAVVTFDPHPLRVLRPEAAPPLIETLAQRLEQLEKEGIEAALVIPFDRDFSLLSPAEFVRQVLVEGLAAEAVLVGPNFRFGHRQQGDVQELARLGERFRFTVEAMPAVVYRGQVVSSTLVRSAIAEGKIEQAGRLLGRPFSLTGNIVPGSGLGRRHVVPTLNLAYEQELVPKRGVYATESVVEGRLYRSATNVGFRPTFDGQKLIVESHLLDFSEELTSGPMEVRFWHWLRDERRFDSVETLRAQIMRDVARARRFFARLDQRRAARTPRAAAKPA
jgi:riboflavin kinase / FMN adenylyltransferase